MNPGCVLSVNYSFSLSYYTKNWTKVSWPWSTLTSPSLSSISSFLQRVSSQKPLLTVKNVMKTFVSFGGPFSPFIPQDCYFLGEMKLFPKSLASTKTLKKSLVCCFQVICRMPGFRKADFRNGESIQAHSLESWKCLSTMDINSGSKFTSFSPLWRSC